MKMGEKVTRTYKLREQQTVPIDQLKLDPTNARQHPARNVDAIAASLARFGQLRPVLHHDGMVVAGNGTLEAARKLGWTEVLAQEIAGLTKKELAAFAIADNRTAELAEWDSIQLDQTLKELSIPLADVGFTEAELEAIIGRKDWDEIDKPKPREESDAHYQERMILVLHDQAVRPALTTALEKLFKERGWKDKVHVG